MSLPSHSPLAFCSAASAAVLSVGILFQATASGGVFDFLHRHRECDGTCTPRTTVEKVQKECWDVEERKICIPAIRFPWEDCSTPKCGRVVTVCSPKKVKYDCGEKRVTKWEVGPPCGACGHLHESGAPCVGPVPALAPLVPPPVEGPR